MIHPLFLQNVLGIHTPIERTEGLQGQGSSDEAETDLKEILAALDESINLCKDAAFIKDPTGRRKLVMQF